MAPSCSHGTSQMKEVRLPRMRCYRCLYEWTPIHSPIAICPRCKSKLWDVPRTRQLRLGHGLGIEEIVRPHRHEILRLVKRHGGRNARVFGSVRRSEADEKSDVDFLVEFQKSSPPLARLDLKIELKELLGREVDVADERTLPWFIKPYAVAEAVPV